MGRVNGNKKVVPELSDFSQKDVPGLDGAELAWLHG
jgi:hypothetical protein